MPGPPRRSRALPLAALVLVLFGAAAGQDGPGSRCKATAMAALREAEGTATFLGAFEAALEGSHRFREAYLATPFLDAAPAAPTALAVPTDAAFAAFAQAMGIEVNDFVRPDLLETTATTLWNHFVAYGGDNPTCGLESEGGSPLEAAGAGARSTCPVAWQRVHDGALMVEGACGDRAGVVEALRVCGEASVYIVDRVLVPAAFCESEPFRSYLARTG